MLILISGCSGAGKNTVISHLLKKNPTLKYLKSCTSRSKENRDDETDSYIFLTREEFENKINNTASASGNSLDDLDADFYGSDDFNLDEFDEEGFDDLKIE